MNELTINEVCKLYNKKDYQVRYAIRQGLIPASKIGWIWIIKNQDLPKDWPIPKRGGHNNEP